MKKNLLSVVAISLGMLVGLVGCNNNKESTDSGKPGSSSPSTSEPATSKPDTSKPGSSDSSTSKPGSSDSSTSGQQEVVKTLKEVTEIAAGLASKTPSTEEYTYTGTVSGVVGNNFYIQDSTGAFYVYMGSTNPNVAKGNKVKVKSKIQNYSGVYESSGTPVVTKLADTGDTISAAKITAVSELAQENQSIAVAFDNVNYESYTEGSKATDSKKDLNLSAKLGDAELKLFVSRFVADYDGIKTKLDAASLGGVMKIEYSLFGWNNGAASINLIAASDFSIQATQPVEVTGVAVEDDDKVSSAKLSLKEGETHQINAHVNPANATDKGLVYSVVDAGDGETAGAVSVSETGLITALLPGKQKVKVASHAKPEYASEIEVTVTEDAAKALERAKAAACATLEAIKTTNSDYAGLTEADKATVDSLINDKKGHINDESVTTTDAVTTALNDAKTEVELKIAKLKACEELDAYKSSEDYTGLSTDEDREQVDSLIDAKKGEINAESVTTKEDVASKLEAAKTAINAKIAELKENAGGDDDTEPDSGNTGSGDSSTSSDSSSSSSSSDSTSSPDSGAGSTDTTSPAPTEPTDDNPDGGND